MLLYDKNIKRKIARTCTCISKCHAFISAK